MLFLPAAHSKIREVISRSPIPEDPSHAQNTLDWLLFLWPDSSPALQTAALGHDIERAYPNQRVSKSDYADYDAYKAAHAQNSARLLASLLVECGCPADFTDEATRLTARHESGGDAISDRLNQADSLSYFDNNLSYYFARKGYEETLVRARWGIKRLPQELYPLVATMTYDDDALNQLVAEVIREASCV